MSERSGTCFFLTGFMGVGKTTLGEMVADQLALSFYDTDTIIETIEGSSISEIFHEKGELYFRELETSVISEIISEGESCIVATGGGAVVSKHNRGLMREAGRVIWLHLPPSTIIANVSGERHQRPLLNQDGWQDSIWDLYRSRYVAYLQCDYDLPLTNDLDLDRSALIHIIRSNAS